MERASTPAWRTILLIEDRDECRISTKWFLSNLGFAVDVVCSGPEALLLFHPNIHDVVVIGRARPGMSETELAHIIKLRAPAKPVIAYAVELAGDGSCIDLLLQSPSHLLLLKEAIESLRTRLVPTVETARPQFRDAEACEDEPPPEPSSLRSMPPGKAF